MRDIKFRAWDEKDKKVYQLETIDFFNHIATIYNTEDELDIYNTELMQYTGLKDKNGKEIYEGDIVTNEYDTGSVFWHQIYAQFQIDNSHTDKFVMPQDEWDLYEVIGNIYENKELLNVMDDCTGDNYPTVN